MDNIAVAKRVVDRILLATDLDPVLHLLDDDLSFEVAPPDVLPICFGDSGKQAMIDYFSALGGIVTFWQVEYFAQRDQVIAVGRERFTMEHTRISADSDFALVFDIHDGLITRLLVVEGLLQDPLAPTVYRGSRAEPVALLA
jgi:ketosteroid isomerase-like protein